MAAQHPHQPDDEPDLVPARPASPEERAKFEAWLAGLSPEARRVYEKLDEPHDESHRRGRDPGT